MEIKLRNKDILRQLDSFVVGFYNQFKNQQQGGIPPRFHSDDFDIDTMEHRCSKQVLLEEYLPNYQEHEGYPVEHCALPIGNLNMREWGPFWYEWKRDFTDTLGANQNTLLNYYWGHGMVGWHTNYPSAGYQIVLTWSETGEGSFNYYDPKEERVVEIPDKKGWQARWFYFGPKEGPVEHHCWHSMWTKCDRFTLCYNWSLRAESFAVGSPRNDALKNLMLDCVEELETA